MTRAIRWVLVLTFFASEASQVAGHEDAPGRVIIRPCSPIEGAPVLGTYGGRTLEELVLVKQAGMNLVITAGPALDPQTPEGKFCLENGIKVMYPLQRYVNLPKLACAIRDTDTVIPLYHRRDRTVPAPGLVQIEEELIRYQESTRTALIGCQRGSDGTRPAAHREGIILFSPEACAREVQAVKESPNLWGWYVLGDSPGDAVSALRALYRTIRRVEGDAGHHPVCAGYGSPGSTCNFAAGVCDIMMLYWYPVGARGYDRAMISREVQWQLTAARARVPGVPFIGVYQAYWHDETTPCPTPQQMREQMEDFVREGACGLIAYTNRLKKPFNGWDQSDSVQMAMRAAHAEIRSMGGLRVSPQPTAIAEARIQPVGVWEAPREIAGLVPAWHVIGPLDDPHGDRLRAVHPPDTVVSLGAAYQGKIGPVQWTLRPSQAGYVGLGELYGGNRTIVNALAYATCTVVSSREQDVQMRFGSDDDAAVFFDRKEVWRHEGQRGAHRDEDIVRVHLKSGATNVLVKVCNRTGQWGFFMRFTDLGGRPLEGLDFAP